MTQSIGDAIAAQVRRYRKLRDISFVRLAEECERIAPGCALTSASLANIERGQDLDAKRRRRDVSVEELLVLSAALRVPPFMLICPIDSPQPITAMSDFEATGLELMDWALGLRLPTLISLGAADYAVEFERNARPLRLVEVHRRLEIEVERNLWRLRNANSALDAQINALEAANISLHEADSRLADARRRAVDTQTNLDLAEALSVDAYKADAATRAAADRVANAATLADAARNELNASLEGFAAVMTEMRLVGVAHGEPPWLDEARILVDERSFRRAVGTANAKVVQEERIADAGR
jgi:transcriptional regulator with XRE-family HTH domain